LDSHPQPEGACSPATLIPGVVFSGSMGRPSARLQHVGRRSDLDLDTLRDFPRVNGVKARGGSMSACGAVVTGGMLYVQSGYGALGNVLLAFAVE